MTKLQAMLDRVAYPFETPRARTARRKAERIVADRRRRNRIAVDKYQARKKAERKVARARLIHDRNLIKPSDSPAERRRKRHNRYMQHWRAQKLQRAAKKLKAERAVKREAKRQAMFAVEQANALRRETRHLKELKWGEGYAHGYRDIMANKEQMTIEGQKAYSPGWRRGYLQAWTTDLQVICEVKKQHPTQ